MFGGLLFLLLTTAAESIYPNFSMQNNAISDLAALGTSTTAIEETAVLGLATCWIVGSYYLFRNTGRKRLMVLNLLPGIGYLLAGLAPENVNLTIHSVGAVFAFPLGAIVVVLSYRSIRGPLRYLPIGLGAAQSACDVYDFLRLSDSRPLRLMLIRPEARQAGTRLWRLGEHDRLSGACLAHSVRGLSHDKVGRGTVMKSGFTLAWIPILIVVAVLATDIGLALYLRSYSPSSLGFWFPFPFFPLLFIPVVFLFFFGMRWFFWGGWGWNRGWYGPYHDSVLETLRQRFALGEITQEQFDDMAKALRGKEEGGECTP